jgi:hypothetical protein
VGTRQRESLLAGRLPRTIECDQRAIASALGVHRRERALGVGIQHDPGGRLAVATVERREVEPRELAGRTLVGVVVALVPDVEVHIDSEQWTALKRHGAHVFRAAR